MKMLERRDVPARHDDFGAIFDDFFTSGLSVTGKISPAVDVAEEKDRYIVKADLPGMKQEDIKVELDDSVLSISGERKHEKEENDEKRNYHYYERSYGSFMRRFILPKGTDSEKIDAKYEHGVLQIIIPKTEAKKAKEIKVK
ncbi:MAG: Hsp20/alpha crystallin family protein [Candidatus Goldbacteria bacterium]|nr:Hsp20/alpha crystallin family protein [Candidatus Goldiibacteriota bacterium]